MSKKPTPESVREALEHTYHSAWNSEAFQREGMNAQRKEQAYEILHALWEEYHDLLNSGAGPGAYNYGLDHAMNCADVLYRKDKP